MTREAVIVEAVRTPSESAMGDSRTGIRSTFWRPFSMRPSTDRGSTQLWAMM